MFVSHEDEFHGCLAYLIRHVLRNGIEFYYYSFNVIRVAINGLVVIDAMQLRVSYQYIDHDKRPILLLFWCQQWNNNSLKF